MLRLFLYPLLLVAGLLALPEAIAAQESDDALSRLVAEALERSPRLAAARSETAAARSRVSQAGAWDDPVLTLGFMNLRTTSFDFSDDFMTMKTVQLGQRIPLPGQLRHRREAASLRAASADQGIAAARIELTSDVKRTYAELYYRDRALEIVERNLALLRGLEDVTHTRYATGVGSQPAVLRAGLEIDGLGAQRVQLAASRHATLARLNALRDRPAGTRLEETPYPPGLLRLSEGRADGPRFASALGIGGDEPGIRGDEPGIGSPVDLPPLDSLLRTALEETPELKAHVARIGAQEEMVSHARAMRWPAPQLTVGYGQREGFADMLNAAVSFRLPIFLGAKQNAAVREETEILAMERARHDRMVAEIEREVTDAYSDVLDALGQLELYDLGILRRAEATLAATLAAYRSGSEDFLALLDSQTRLYGFELERHRRLADLLVAWSELESAVGEEIEP